jgi:hypothetical protein
MTERPEKHNRDGCTGKDGLAMREDELVMVDRVTVGGFAPPTLIMMGYFYHHDRM